MLQRANLRDGEDEEGGDDEQVVFSEYYSHLLNFIFDIKIILSKFCKNPNFLGAHTSPDPAGGCCCPPFPCVSDLHIAEDELLFTRKLEFDAKM